MSSCSAAISDRRWHSGSVKSPSGSQGPSGSTALAQACIVLAYWAVFRLGCAIVGIRHAVLAVLLMVGIAAFSVPSPDFGPAILAAPLWALALLYYWRALGERRRGYWFLLALVLGLLMLASYAGLILFVLFVVFVPLTPRGRASLLHPEPWIALILLFIVVFPHALWLAGNRSLVLEGFDENAGATGRLSPGIWLFAVLVLTHLGLALLVMLASGWPRHPRERAPEIERHPVEPLARAFVYLFAIAPALVAIAVVFVSNRLGPLDRVTPARRAVRARGRARRWRQDSALSRAVGVVGLVRSAVRAAGFGRDRPCDLALDRRHRSRNRAARQRGRAILTETSFSAAPVSRSHIVSGDPRLAPLIALAAPNRPHVYFAWAPHRSPWANPADFRTHGGILVWPAADNTGTPPATLKAQFPDLVTEVPRSFPRTVQGVLPLIRLGWSMLRPAAPQ